MGHNLNIHTSHYRLQSNVLERGKVAKLLLAVEKGLISKYDEERELEEIATEQIELDLDAGNQFYPLWIGVTYLQAAFISHSQINIRYGISMISQLTIWVKLLF